MAKCPVCGGRLELFAGGYFGMIYECRNCGYRGVVALEVEPADFEEFWGVSPVEVWCEILRKLPEESGIVVNGKIKIYDRSRATAVLDRIVREGLKSLPGQLSRKLCRENFLDRVMGNPLRNIFIKMLIETAWLVKVEDCNTNKR